MDGDNNNQDDLVEIDEDEMLDFDDNEDELAAELDVMEMEEGAAAEDIPDDAEITFTKHTGSVFCVSVDPATSSMAVTGGEDDKAYVWRLTDGETLLECTGHKDSVTCACFSHDSVYVAIGDMAGLVKVWKVDSKEEVWTFDIGADLEWMDWHFGAHVLLAGTQDGQVWIWRIPSGDCKTLQGHGAGANIGKVMPDGKRLAVGYEDGSLKSWDLKSATQLQNITGNQAHQGPITCMACHHDNVVVATGSLDGSSKIINSNTGKVLATFNCALEGGKDKEKDEEEGEDSEGTDSVESVGLSKSFPIAATGSLNGALMIWDISSQTRRHICKHETGISRLKFDPNSPFVYTSTLDGVLHMWDCRSGKKETQWTGHTEEILDFEISRDGNHLVTASGDQTAKVFSLQTPDR